MKYTAIQQQALRLGRLTKVIYRNMYKTDHELGYSTKGTTKYEINVASDAPSKDIQDVVLIHEYGHIYYGHCDRVDLKVEFQTLEAMCKEMHKDYIEVMESYGGPHSFVNIAMDLQINSELLCNRDVKIMTDANIGICTPEAFGIEQSIDNDFRDYYKPLIEKAHITKENKELSRLIKKLMQDLPKTISAFDGDLSSAIRKALMDEDYQGGDSKSSSDNVTKSSTLGDETGLSGNQKNGYSDTSLNAQQLTIREDIEPAIRQLLLDIVGKSKGHMPDAMRSYNRGIRRDASGIIHTSVKSTRAVNKKKLGILVDVSGSMDAEPLIKAISTVKNVAPNLDPASIVCTWDTQKKEDWEVAKMPDSFTSGGGTELSKGLSYLEDKKCQAIIVYSDMQTPMDKMIKAAKDLDIDLYTIQVCTSTHDPIDNLLAQYFSINKKFIRVAA